MIPPYLSQFERVELAQQAREESRLELQWRRKMTTVYNGITRSLVDAMVDKHEFEESLVDFEPFLVEHLFEIYKSALRGAKRLAAPPKGSKPPSTLEDLQDVWRRWRRRRDVPKRQRAIAKRLKDSYLKRVRKVWTKYSEAFREGRSFDKEEIVVAVKRELKVSHSRALTTVNTETTNHYNAARRNFYDASNDVTHYLFTCIRDHRTTRWCSTRAGLVYKKGDPLTDKETPAIHWNCRSTMVPLTPANPKHLSLINNKSIQRRNRTCEPLPKNWKKVL